MRNIGDQFRFHTLIFKAVLYRCIQAFTDMVDIICYHLLFSRKLLCWNLVLKVTIRDFFQTSYDLLSSPGFFDQIIKNCTVHYDHQKQRKR